MKNILELGAIGDGIFDNTIIINLALQNYNAIYIPSGHFRITQPLVIPYTRQIEGDGYSSMVDYQGTNFQDIIKIENSPAGGRISRIQLLSSNLSARHSIHIEMSEGKYVNRHIIEQCWLHGYGGGAGIGLTNPNLNGYFCSQIRDNTIIGGGIQLDNCGDSVGVTGNLITGPGPGIELTFVPGAANSWIRDNNITAQGRAISLGNAAQNIEIRGNQIEHTVADPQVDYIVSIRGGVNRNSNVEFVGNNVNGMLPTTVTLAGVEVANLDYILIERNKFTGVPYGVHTRTSSKFITYGCNNVYNGGITNLNNGKNIKYL